MEYKVTTHSEEETIEIAQNFESEKFPNMVICLNGELGSGKTVFTKGTAQALGITETITSPTFSSNTQVTALTVVAKTKINKLKKEKRQNRLPEACH